MLKLQVIVSLITTIFCCITAVAQSDSVLATITKGSDNYSDTLRNEIYTPTNGFSSSTKKVTTLPPSESTLKSLQEIPNKYISTIDKKIDRYSSRISNKTEKTLKKLAKWEEKIKPILQKANPEVANRLFGNHQLTFSSLLQKIQQGQSIQLDYRRQYNKYHDDVTTGIKYLEKNKEYLDSGLAKRIQSTKQKLQQLNAEEDSTQAIQQFIKERKKELISNAIKYIGNSKYLTKINKEVWYYAETMKNYKELFSDEAQTEKQVKDALNKIPGFQSFVQKNSMLSSLFGSTMDVASNTGYQGLQTRAGVQTMIQQRLGGITGGTQGLLRQQLSEAQGQLNTMKEKLIKNPFADNGGGDLPDFKPNTQKTKTILQRLEFGSNIQFAKNNSLMPTTADIALTVGYKLNDKSVAGIGAGYKLGLGRIDKIRFSTEGINLRSFIDWKLKKQFYVTGGWEINYLATPVTGSLIKPEPWQQSGLAGLCKKFSVKSKWVKQTQIKLLYDFLAKQHIPFSQPLLFRVGYSF